MGLVLVMLAGCARDFNKDMETLKRSFDDQRTAVELRNPEDFVRSMSAMVTAMQNTMKAVDAMPAEKQGGAATEFAKIGDVGEKLYYSADFRSFFDSRLEGTKYGKQVERLRNKMKSTGLADWLKAKQAAGATQ